MFVEIGRVVFESITLHNLIQIIFYVRFQIQFNEYSSIYRWQSKRFVEFVIIIYFYEREHL